MKKLIASLIAVSMIATPALAQRSDRQYRSYERYERYEHHHRGVSTGGAIAIGLGALILGSAIANSNNRRERAAPVYQDYRTQVCQDIIKYDYYGNPYVVGRNCWYQ